LILIILLTFILDIIVLIMEFLILMVGLGFILRGKRRELQQMII
jgi:hypothetical protein